MKAVMAFAMVLLASSAMAKSPDFGDKAPKPLPPVPYAVTPANMDEHGPFVQRVLVTVQMGKGKENPVWMMTHTASQVWLGKLTEPEPVAPVDPAVLKQVKSPSASYRGLKIEMQLVNGKKFDPITLYNGKVVGPKSMTVKNDPGRGLEYWVFSTARVRRDLLVGPQVLPVISFEQCRLLGMEIVATEPRQCLLPDKTILLQTEEKPTRASLRAKDFDSCLKHGKALINSFPRRCIAAGGRVFAEPPRVIETPADAPLAAGVSGTLQVPAGVSVTTSSVPVTPTQVVNPLLGTYVVSGTQALVSATEPAACEILLTAGDVSSTVRATEMGCLVGGGVSGTTVTTPTVVVTPTFVPVVISGTQPVSDSWVAPDLNPGAGPESWRAWTARKVEDLRLWLKAKGF